LGLLGGYGWPLRGKGFGYNIQPYLVFYIAKRVLREAKESTVKKRKKKKQQIKHLGNISQSGQEKWSGGG